MRVNVKVIGQRQNKKRGHRGNSQNAIITSDGLSLMQREEEAFRLLQESDVHWADLALENAVALHLQSLSSVRHSFLLFVLFYYERERTEREKLLLFICSLDKAEVQ